MDEASFILLTTASKERLEEICAALKKEEIPYKLKAIPGSDSPARGSIVNLNKQVMVPEESLLKARDATSLAGEMRKKEYMGLNQMIRILLFIIIILGVAFYVVRYL